MAVRRELDVQEQRRNPTQCQNRSNEYFVPKDGIDREVITADICRYLGNDALVRPGTYKNPVTKTAQPGYYVTAYRNLTSAMIEDLKADSQRWDQERRAANSRANAGYTQSRTHESRQQCGPSGESKTDYLPVVNFQQGYEQFSKISYPQPPIGGYGQPPPPPPPSLSSGYIQKENHYIAGSNMNIEQSRGFSQPVNAEIPRVSAPQYVQVPLSQQYPNPASAQNYSRGVYSQPPPLTSNPRRVHEDSNFVAPIITPPSSFQEEKKAYYAQPATGPPYGNSYSLRETYSDRNFPEPRSYNHAAIPPSIVHPVQSHLQKQFRPTGRDRELEIRDSRHNRDSLRRQ